MTYAQFLKLKAGDIVLWNGRVFRTVLQGPADDGSDHIKFAIRRRSWTGRATTGYVWTDVKNKIARTNQVTARAMLPSEREHLEKIGFSPIAELKREWTQGLATALRMGNRCKLRIRRLPTL